MTSLFDPLLLGDLALKNRIIMAPLTRMRSHSPGNVPHAINATYYGQRATAGLIISEATQISQQGQGYPGTPGIYTKAQVEGWKLVTKAVHEQNGKILLQLWHVGRISHSSYQNGGLPVAPSALKPTTGGAMTAQGKQVPFETPHALVISEIKAILKDYQVACENAKQAGFDGVEIHGANGYLVDQFLQDGSNQRQDAYGGSIPNRARFLKEVVEVAIGVWGKGRVGVRLSPFGTTNDMKDSDPVHLFSYVLEVLSSLEIAYVHLVEPRADQENDPSCPQASSISEVFKKHFQGGMILAGGYTPETAKKAVLLNEADAIAFGRWYISNPDLAMRIEKNLPLTPYDRKTFYGGGEQGYTDYPFFSEIKG